MNEELKPNTTDDLIDILKKNIENDKSIQMNAIVGRIPLLCQSVLDIHVILKEVKINQEKINEKLDDKFVTKDGTFWVIKSIVFGGAGIILITVMGALVYLVVK